MSKPAILALRRSDKLIMLGIAVLGGGGLGIALPLIWNGIKNFAWLPFHDPLSWFMSLEADYMLYLRPLILITLATAAAVLLIVFSPVVEVSDEEIRIKKGNDQRTIKRSDVAGVYLEGSKIIIESSRGRKLFHDNIEGGKVEVKKVFVDHGYPWES